MSDQSIDRRGPGMAAVSLILGVFGLMVVWIPIVGMIAWLLSPLGLLLGLAALGNPADRGVAIAGVTCSAVGLAACVAWARLFSLSVSI
eukprot:gene19939-19839_t